MWERRLFDWTHIGDPAARFENYVAFELLALTQWWNDQGLGPYHLFYVRDKDGHESDFLIVYEQCPWLLIEVKLTDQGISSQHTRHADQLGKIPVLKGDKY